MRGLAAFLILLWFHGPLSGQSIEGRLLDSGTGAPIILGEIILLRGDGEVADRTFTDEEGFFAVHSPEPGSFLLRAERLGYASRVDGIFDLGVGGVLSVEFRLSPNPLVLDTLGVEVERRDTKLALLGFYVRERIGLGRFIGPEEISRKVVIDASDLFRNIPRVRVNHQPFGGTTITIGGARGSTLRGEGCYPRVLIDGMEVFRGGRQAARIDQVISPSEIGGIEIYRGGAETPLQFGGMAGACGVILIWTR